MIDLFSSVSDTHGAPVNHELHHLHCCGSSPFCDPFENEFMANVRMAKLLQNTIVSVAALLPFLIQMVLAVAVAVAVVLADSRKLPPSPRSNSLHVDSLPAERLFAPTMLSPVRLLFFCESPYGDTLS